MEGKGAGKINSVLILFAHPRFEKSRVNRALLSNIQHMPHVTLHDLYEHYPDFNIDIEREKDILSAHQVVIWHHPLYMYGAPALLKQWIDMVLEFGWAHGAGGNNLKGKVIFNTLTSGGTREAYTANSHHRFTIRQFLTPFEQTATLCRMIYLPPFAVQGTHLLTDEGLMVQAGLYRALMEDLTQGDFDIDNMRSFPFLNDWLMNKQESKKR
jgi:glutathione-regulated potassium-efflux system ancillary protein KefG